MENRYGNMGDGTEIPDSPDPMSQQHDGADRGETQLKNNKNRGNKGKVAKIIVMMAVVTALLIFGILALIIAKTSGDETSTIPDATLNVGNEERNPISEMQAKLARQRAKANAENNTAEPAPEPETSPREERKRRAEANADRMLGNRSPQQQSGKSDELTPAQRRLQGSVLIGGSSGSAGASSTSGAQPVAQRSGGSAGSAGLPGGSTGSAGRSNEIGSSLRGETYQPGSARRMAGLDMLLRRGTIIPCVIQNRIVSTHPSLSSCRITENVYSADGSTVLIESGSIAYGEQKVALLQGQARLFVTWNEIDTAGGVRVRIDSLGIDPLGASGVNAWVDKHFWQRFGGAIMLSFVDDGLSALASQLEKSQDSNVNFDNSTDNAGNMAELALENSINIEPTGYVNQGTRMSIRVARDVDFSHVYNVEVAP